MRDPRPYTLKDTAMLLRLLYDFHWRAMTEHDYEKAKRFALLSMEIDRNSRSKLEPMNHGPKRTTDSR